MCLKELYQRPVKQCIAYGANPDDQPQFPAGHQAEHHADNYDGHIAYDTRLVIFEFVVCHLFDDNAYGVIRGAMSST